MYHTSVPGYHNHSCNPVTPSPTKQSIPESTFFTFLIEIDRGKQITSRLCSRHLVHQWRSLCIPPSLWMTSYEKRTSLIMTVTLSWKRMKLQTCHVSVVQTFLHSVKPISVTKNGSSANSVACSTTLDEPIITNKLYEQQKRYIEENERARRLSQTLAIAEAHRTIASSL